MRYEFVKFIVVINIVIVSVFNAAIKARTREKVCACNKIKKK